MNEQTLAAIEDLLSTGEARYQEPYCQFCMVDLYARATVTHEGWCPVLHADEIMALLRGKSSRP